MTRNLLFIILMMCVPTLTYAQTESTEPVAEETLDDDVLDLDFRLDLRIEVLDMGMEAPFSGILFTTDALTKMQLSYDKELSLLKNEKEYMQAKFGLQLQALMASWQNEKMLYTAELNAKRNYIEDLEEKLIGTSDWTPAYMIGSFIVGAATTIAITYAITGATQ
tara:strand:+ start:3384 stop:3878 length:495 start_codon:yes stop_codon:yes gene_type:complete